jgi:hypothetical protein
MRLQRHSLALLDRCPTYKKSTKSYTKDEIAETLTLLLGDKQPKQEKAGIPFASNWVPKKKLQKCIILQ